MLLTAILTTLQMIKLTALCQLYGFKVWLNLKDIETVEIYLHNDEDGRTTRGREPRELPCA